MLQLVYTYSGVLPGLYHGLYVLRERSSVTSAKFA